MPGEKKGQLILREPKRSSRRTINLPRVCLSALPAHRLAHRSQQEEERLLAGSRWEDSDFVFTSGIGTPSEPRNLQRAFDQIVAIAGLPTVRIHDLRHTAATSLLTQGVHPLLLMELLGHCGIAVTMNTYSHVVAALRTETANEMDAILNLQESTATTVATKLLRDALN
jgi:integrase